MLDTSAVRLSLTVIALLSVLITACGEPYTRPAPPTYTVRSGDTVYSIAWRHGLDFRELARWNNLSASHLIYPGQVLRLQPRAGQHSATAKPGSASPPANPPVAPAPREELVSAWTWPIDKVVNVARSVAPGSLGILIAGSEGQAVKAAAAGRVVYTGSGLRGMGQLVIIKHTEVFLSAYGLNRELSVKEGDSVRGGQTIATMGLGPARKAALYFEIRLNGKPVDPLRYLPPPTRKL